LSVGRLLCGFSCGAPKALAEVLASERPSFFDLPECHAEGKPCR